MILRLAQSAFLLGIAMLLSPVASAIGIGLQPTTVEMSLQPGERQRQAINIVNVHQEKTISLTIGLADWSLDDEGQILLAAPGDLDRSASDWARFSPGFVTLEPGESDQIIVDIAVPARVGAPGDHRFALLASTILPEERGAGAGVWRRYQLASLFYVTTGEAESLPGVTASGLSVDDAGATMIGLQIENSGNAHARLDGVVEVIVGDDTAEYPIANVVVLDNGRRNLQVPIGGELPKGAEIRIALENSFVPQSSTGVRSLDPVEVAWAPADLAPSVVAEAASTGPKSAEAGSEITGSATEATGSGPATLPGGGQR